MLVGVSVGVLVGTTAVLVGVSLGVLLAGTAVLVGVSLGVLLAGTAVFVGVSLGVLLAGTAVYALAHVASGTWLLPLAALGAGLVWAFLFAWTRNLTAPIVSHVLFDVLVLLIAPLA